jgi:RHS repeat-associated protein
LFEPESFAPLAKLVNGERFGIVTDHLGTPTAMFDGEGREVWGAEIDVYGDLRNLRREREACPFRWPGQYEDGETGLYYNRFRYYSHDHSAFISQDPIGLLGGLAVFGYVRDPLHGVDFLGLSECLKKGNPLPADTLVHRIGGADAGNLALKPAERKLTLVGISMLRAASPEEASSLAKKVAREQRWTRMETAAETMGTATVADIRSAGFDVIHDPTANVGDAHARLVHPEGSKGFTPENLSKLANVFSNKGGL